MAMKEICDECDDDFATYTCIKCGKKICEDCTDDHDCVEDI